MIYLVFPTPVGSASKGLQAFEIDSFATRPVILLPIRLAEVHVAAKRMDWPVTPAQVKPS
jgi:hypothetical protein